ncbi:MAG: fused MFS/spermidine synthase [Bryobacterales bacterium]|nr:fused MFS/spermidine synthase [Bryobacterales bacterium]
MQPLLAGLLLPRHGGVAGVWAVAMFFFPCVLLAGYAYASFAARKPRIAALVALLSLAWLPLRVPELGSDAHPVWTLLATLLLSSGLPFFVLSATSPTVQSWFGSYRLYALSNAASLLALLIYPFLIEPNLTRSMQLKLWSAAYALYVIAFVLTTWRAAPPAAHAVDDHSGWPLWLALSAIPAALWLAVANEISQSVAPVPLLWILPLATYLLTLILCFEGNWYRPGLFKWLLTPAVVALLFASKQHHWNTSLPLGLGLFLSGLFVCSMICHGELARRKPHAARPVRFYLAIAAGGALGTAFVSLLAPAVFADRTEFHIAVVAVVVAGFGLLFVHLTAGNLLRLAVVSTAAFVFAQYQQGGGLRVRNFYGILEVQDKPETRLLSNGTIIHGVQFRDAARTRLATAYYAPETAIGRLLQAPSTQPRRVGIVGLGVGTLAAYAKDADTYRFYEINPAVVDIARKHFLFLGQSKGRTEVVLGDARLAMEREPAQRYDVLVIDAFSGDAVPTHLLTREAFQVYFRHLAPGGTLALHVTGKYVNLAPVAEAIALSLGWRPRTVTNAPLSERQVFAATWVLVEGRTNSRPDAKVWTDDRVALWETMRR